MADIEVESIPETEVAPTTSGSFFGSWTFWIIVIVVIVVIAGAVFLMRRSPATIPAPEQKSVVEEIKRTIAEVAKVPVFVEEQKKVVPEVPRISVYGEHMKKCICGVGDKWTKEQCQAPDTFENGNCIRDNVSVEDAKKLCDAKPGCVGFDHVPAWGNKMFYKTANTPLNPHNEANAYVKM